MSLFAGEDISICVCLAILTYLFDEQGNKLPSTYRIILFVTNNNDFLPIVMFDCHIYYDYFGMLILGISDYPQYQQSVIYDF